MSRLREELTDPWGLLVAGVAGGVAAAATIPAAPAVGIGLAVYGLKVGLGLASRRTRPAPRRASGPVSPAVQAWVERAEEALAALHAMAAGTAAPPAASPGASPTDAAAAQAAAGADEVLATMHRLADQSVGVDGALRRAEAPGLDEEGARLAAVAAARPDDASAQQSAAAVADRLAVRDRLRAARAALEGRLQSSALGLEGLVARLAELQVAAATVGEVDPTAQDLADLTTEVEGLRRGLADAEQATRAALSAG